MFSADSETPSGCVCARPSDPPKQCQRAAPRAWPLILPFKPSITFWNSLQNDCQMTSRASNLDSNLNSAAWPTSCKGLSLRNRSNKLCGVWIFLKSVTDAKFEPSVVKFLMLIPQTVLTDKSSITISRRSVLNFKVSLSLFWCYGPAQWAAASWALPLIMSEKCAKRKYTPIYVECDNMCRMQ